MIDARAYTEVYCIINLLSKVQRDKIPKEIKEKIEMKMDKNYKFVIDNNIKDDKLLKDTKKILSVLYTDYLATIEEKDIIKAKEKSKFWQNEKKKIDNYNLFKAKQSNKNDK